MDLSEELKAIRIQFYTDQLRSRELDRQLASEKYRLKKSVRKLRGDTRNLGVRAFADVAPCCLSVFSNDLVMDIIAGQLPIQSVLNCRLVCKEWAGKFSEYLKFRKPLIVADTDCKNTKEVLEKKREGMRVSISTLCILGIPIGCPPIREIISHFGGTISGVKIDDCSPQPKSLISLLRSVPTLDELSFRQSGVRCRHSNSSADSRDSEVETDEENEINSHLSSTLDGLTAYCNHSVFETVTKLSWEEMNPVKHFERLLTMFPRLNELELKCRCTPDPLKLQGHRMDNLKQLTILCNDFLEQNFVALACLELKLERLTLKGIEPGGKKEMGGLKMFLQSVAPTITELIVLKRSPTILEMIVEQRANVGRQNLHENLQTSPNTFIRQASPFPIHFPKLQRLQIDTSLVTDPKIFDYMPLLQKLECKFGRWKDCWDLLNAKRLPTKKLECLREVALGAIDSGCLEKMLPVFGGITSLEISDDRINDVAFRTICAQMHQLVHLKITPSTNAAANTLQLTDSGVTGIEPEGLEELRRILPKKLQDKHHIQRMRKSPYIGNLRGLNSMELSMSRCQITDLSVLYGVADLRQISTITLPKCNLTDTSVNALGDIPSLSKLEMHKNASITPEALGTLKATRDNIIFNFHTY